jgi:hypothetical protein
VRDRTPASQGFGYLLAVVGGPPGGLGAVLISVPPLYPVAFPAQIPFSVPVTSPFPGSPVALRVQLSPSAWQAELVLQAAALRRTPPFNLTVSHALRLRVH